MSMGYCASCRKVSENEREILYEYTCYNIGEINWEGSREAFDGVILIKKAALVEPVIHENFKNTSNGKKLVSKRVHVDVSMSELISSGRIRIENCSGTWQITDGGMDIMALRLVRKLFSEYQNKGAMPEKTSFFC